MDQPQTFPSSSPELEEVLLDRLEMDNLHVLNVVTAIGNDLKDDRAALLRSEKMTPSRCGIVEGGSEMPEDDTVNWKTQNHYYPPQQVTPQQSTLSKLAGPLLIGASLLGAGGIGTAGWVAVKAIDKISNLQQSGKVEDGSMTIEFIGGQEAPPVQ